MGAPIDLGYTPRPQQLALHTALEQSRWVVAVCHRRMGKTVCAINHVIFSALESTAERPRYAYIAPTYRQAKLIAWDYVKAYTAKLPGIVHRESDLIVNFPNGARMQLFGADNPDALRGLFFDGVVFDEFGLQPANVFSEVVRPALMDRKGWALFLGTPNGKNQFYEAVQTAEIEDEWKLLTFKASETGLIEAKELEAAKQVMTPDEYDCEFECSFEAAVKGAIYAEQVKTAREEGRVCNVPYDPALPVDTDWDLGMGDSTVIIFSQSFRSGEIRIIDYVESSGEGLQYYANVLKMRPYSYGKHWAPHDIAVRELGTGKSRLEVAAGFGIKFEVTPRVTGGASEVEDGIHAARLFWAKCWFDEGKARPLIEALQHYRRDYNARLGEFRATPVHDWSSHAADAFRGLAVRHRLPKAKRKEPDFLDIRATPESWSWV
jgi:phage terminase large subunit